MKRDLDIIRELLFFVEENANYPENILQNWNEFESKYSDAIVFGHLSLLIDAGFIDALDTSDMSKMSYAVKRITMDGHDYLDSVRDPKIWRDTKAGLAKVGGTTSLAVVQATAVALFKTALSQAGINVQ